MVIKKIILATVLAFGAAMWAPVELEKDPAFGYYLRINQQRFKLYINIDIDDFRLKNISHRDSKLIIEFIGEGTISIDDEDLETLRSIKGRTTIGGIDADYRLAEIHDESSTNDSRTSFRLTVYDANRRRW